MKPTTSRVLIVLAMAIILGVVIFAAILAHNIDQQRAQVIVVEEVVDPEPELRDIIVRAGVFDVDGEPVEGARLTALRHPKIAFTNPDGFALLQFETSSEQLTFVVWHEAYNSVQFFRKISDEIYLDVRMSQ